MKNYGSIIASTSGILFGVILIGFVFLISALVINILQSDISTYIIEVFSSLPSEYLSGFISGIFATLIGFSLTMAWDIFKFYRDQYVRDGAILASARHELDASCDNIRTNISWVTQEKQIASKKQSIVTPLLPLSRDIWELVKFNLPRKLQKNPTLLAQVCDASYSLGNLNEVIQSRENYRINNGGMSNFDSRLEIYNDILLESMPNVLNEIIELRKLL